MREFKDKQGQRWQVAPLEASYGTILLIFSPVKGHDIRQYPMDSDYLAQAEATLADCDEAALREYLAQALPWNPG